MSVRTFTFNVTAPGASALADRAGQVTAGQSLSFDAPSLLAFDSSNNSYPWQSPYVDIFGTIQGGTGMLDWCSNLAWSPSAGGGGRFMAAGGRPAAISASLGGRLCKLIYYDVTQNKWDSVQNPFGDTTGAGHLYQSFCNAESINRFFYRRYENGQPIQVWNTQDWVKDTQISAMPSFDGSSTYGEAVALVWMPTFSLAGVPMTQGALLAMGSNGGTWRCLAFDWANRALGAAAWKKVFSVAESAPTVSGGNLYGHMAGIYVPLANAAVMGAPIGRRLMVIKSDGTYFESDANQPTDICVQDERGVLTPHPSEASAIFFPSVASGTHIYELVIGASSATWVQRDLNPRPERQKIGGTIPDLGVVVFVTSASDELGREMHIYRPNF